MLVKNLEFKNKNGQKVKIVDIPVFTKESPLYFKVNVKLNLFINKLDFNEQSQPVYSFRDYLKKVLKWNEYDHIYHDKELKNNA